MQTSTAFVDVWFVSVFVVFYFEQFLAQQQVTNQNTENLCLTIHKMFNECDENFIHAIAVSVALSFRADDEQTSWIIALWWLSASLWRIRITFL